MRNSEGKLFRCIWTIHKIPTFLRKIMATQKPPACQEWKFISTWRFIKSFGNKPPARLLVRRPGHQQFQRFPWRISTWSQICQAKSKIEQLLWQSSPPFSEKKGWGWCSQMNYDRLGNSSAATLGFPPICILGERLTCTDRKQTLLPRGGLKPSQ